MADVSTSYWKKWTFNFYYGEELRSLYMNGILLAGFRPGVYNANIISFIQNSDGSSGPLNFIIKRGTTLIFANNYKNVNGFVERDFTGIGKETSESNDQYSYLIKCVANEDLLYRAADFTETFHSYKGDFHLFARIKYSAKAESTSTSMEGYPEVEIIPYRVRTNGSGSRFEILSPEGETVDMGPYDGMSYDTFKSNYNSNANYLKYSYLDLGIIQKTKTEEGSPTSDDFGFNNYIFTGRGLPEYRQSFIPSTYTLTPDILVGPDFKTLYLDIPGISCDGVVYENAAESINREIAINFTSSHWDEKNKLILPAIPDPDNEENLFVYPPTDPNSKNKYACYLDFIFLATNKNLSNYEYLESEGTKFQNMLLDDKSLKLYYERFRVQGPNNRNAAFLGDFSNLNVDDAGDYNSFDAGVEWEISKNNRKGVESGTTKGFFAHTLYDLDSENGDLINSSTTPYYAPITPLDVSVANQKRLFNIIKNKQVLPMMIDYLRQDRNNAALYSTIIPVALIFRKFIKNEGQEGFWVGSVENAGRINPANILSFFDLQFKETKLQSITMKNSDVYNTLSVIA